MQKEYLKRGLALSLQLATLLTAVACATPGPTRSTLVSPVPAEDAPTLGALEDPEPTPPVATPFAAGFMAGLGYRLGEVEDGSRFMPLQLVTGSAALTAVRGHTLSALGIVGASGTSVSHAQGAWGFGASLDVTDGKRPYEAALSTGMVWFSEGGPPAAFLGGTFVFKL